MPKTDAAWEAWGQLDPYYGVVSHQNFRKERLAENRDLFFSDGQRVMANRLARYEGVFGRLPRGRALDFGCGVGRLALPLADAFDEVVGLDIAPSMLVEARRNAAEAGASNVVFALSDDDLTGAPGGFDFVHSYIVLQHIPVRRGLRIIDRLVDKVTPGGGLALHVSVHTRGPAWRAAYWTVHHVPLAHALSSAVKGRSQSDPVMQMNGYPLQRILTDLARRGVHEVQVVGELHHGVATFNLFARVSEGT